MSITAEKLYAEINAKQSFLCVGLDPDLEKIPPEFLTETRPTFYFQ